MMPQSPSTHRFLPLVILLVALAVSLLSAPRLAAADPEIRGFWIEAWSNGLKTPAQIDQLIADVRAGNFNTIIPQVRRRGDTLYFSEIEPRIEDWNFPPDFDALAYLIEQARAQNPPIEVHAWIVAYPIWRSENTPPQSPEHVVNRHPEWLSQNYEGAFWDGDNYQHDPGHPGVQQHLFDVCMELITKYDVDGLHFDYIRLTNNTWGYNPVSVERFQRLHNRTDIPAPNDEAWRQFRRDQITQTLRKIYLSAKEVRPDVKISAATITWAPGPSTLSDWYFTSAYRSVMQDWRGWMEEGILDLNVPMAYFREHTHPHDWLKWINFAKNHRYNRHVAIGPGIWLNSIPNTVKQMRDTRAPSPQGNFGQGVVGYSFQGTNNEGRPRSDLLHALTQPSVDDLITPPMFAEVASIPEMPWITSPTTGHVKGFVHDIDSGGTVDGAVVHLSGDLNRTIQTDATGFFGFVDLPPGNYSLHAAFDGDETLAVAVAVSAGEVVHADLYLGEIPEEEPTIASHPQSQTVFVGRDLVLTVEANGIPPPDYQWQFNGADIPGERRSALLLTGIDFGSAGDYRVVVSNPHGAIESEIARVAIREVPERPLLSAPEISSHGAFEAELLGTPGAWFLVESSTDLVAWLPLMTLGIRNRVPVFGDPDWFQFDRRFYRARAVDVRPLANFEDYDPGQSVLFNVPSYSGSTRNYIATGGNLPNFAITTTEFPGDIDATQVLHAAWSFVSGTDDPWLRLTTYHAAALPNPIVDFSHGIRLDVFVDRPIHLAIGLRETHSSGEIGENGGVVGDIEWVGGHTDNSSSPPLGRFIPAGEWTPVHFFIPHEPLQGHTGNGILESFSGKGVFENLTIVPADGPGIYNLYLGDILTIELPQ